MTGEVTDRALNEFYPDPQQYEPIPIYICEECGKGINEGDDFWSIDGNEYCEDCAEDMFRHTATRD